MVTVILVHIRMTGTNIYHMSGVFTVTIGKFPIGIPPVESVIAGGLSVHCTRSICEELVLSYFMCGFFQISVILVSMCNMKKSPLLKEKDLIVS